MIGDTNAILNITTNQIEIEGSGQLKVEWYSRNVLIKIQYCNYGENVTHPSIPIDDKGILIFDTWSRNNLNITEDTIIVANWKTISELTELDIELDITSGLTVTLYMMKWGTNILTVNWGDGTISTNNSNNVNFKLSRTYLSYGKYKITIGTNGSDTWTSNSYLFNTIAGQSVLKNCYLGKSINKIGSAMFRYCYYLEELLIPTTINNIQNYAFANSGIINIIIPSSVTISNDYLFYQCFSLQKVIYLGTGSPGARYNCAGSNALKTFIFKGEVSILYDNIFNGCSSLIYCIIPEGVVQIGDFAFNACTRLRKVVIPSTVTTLGAAFMNTAIKEYHILPLVPPTVISTMAQCIPVSQGLVLYVPNISLNDYKTAPKWIDHAQYMVGE